MQSSYMADPEIIKETEDNSGLILIARLMLWTFVNTAGYTRELTPEQIAERFQLFRR